MLHKLQYSCWNYRKNKSISSPRKQEEHIVPLKSLLVHEV